MAESDLSPNLDPLVDPVVVALGSSDPEYSRVIDQIIKAGLKVRRFGELNELLSALREHVVALILLQGNQAQLDTLKLVELIRDHAPDIPLVVAAAGDARLTSQWITAGVHWILRAGAPEAEILPALQVMIERYDRLRSAEAAMKGLQSQITSEHERVNRFGRSFGELNHELNTPLAVIQGYCGNLLDGIQGSLSKDQHESVERIHFACNLMKGVVSRIKKELPRPEDTPRPQADARSSQRRQIRVSRLAQEVVALFERSYAAANKGLSLEVEPKTHPIWADRARLSQLLVNLLSNAQRHTPPGGATVIKVGPAPDAERESCQVTVHNSGEPIPAADLEEVFRPGWTRTDDPPGKRAGLGLAICKEVAAEHGGILTVESSADQGTVFHLVLPADPRNRRRRLTVHLVQDETLSGQLLLELKKLSHGKVQLKKPPSVEVLARQIHDSGLPLVLLGAAQQGLERVLRFLDQ